jgi:hypothetical protein
MNRLSRAVIISGIAFCSLGIITYAEAKGRKDNWEISNIKDSLVTFKNGEQLNTSLYNVKLLAKLNYKAGSPVLIFTGTDCTDCCERKSVFLFTPGEKEKKVEPEYAPYDFPGKEYSSLDSTLLYESRMFVGNVLPNVPNGIIWYQNMLTEYGTYEPGIYLIKIVNGKMTEKLEFEHLPDIKETLDQVKLNKAVEIKGEDYVADDSGDE